MEIKIYHFFSDLLNLYGDRGNILALKYRAEQRGIKLDVVDVKDVSNISLNEADLFFIGGGSDASQSICTEQLLKIKEDFKLMIEDGTPGLTICGGYQFLGERYVTAEGEDLKTLEILDFYTEAKKDKSRLIGNILVESEQFGKICGYENHGGRTYHNYKTLGDVIVGSGNNGEDGKEGLIYNNLIGTYLHGPILPKNPQITDYLLLKAIERKYGIGELEPIDDSFERRANEAVWSMFNR